MTTMVICSVYDSATEAYMQPFFAMTKAAGARMFSDACAEKNSPFYKHPEDFVLMSVGTWDDNAGVIVSNDPIKIITAMECVTLESAVVDMGNAKERHDDYRKF